MTNSFIPAAIILQVSAFSTWDKELPKIVFDARYLLLNQKERKTAFEQYVRTRAEEERIERKNKLKEKKEAFKALLEEAKVTTRYVEPSADRHYEAMW